MKNFQKYDVVKNMVFMKQYFQERIGSYFPDMKGAKLQSLQITILKDWPTRNSRYCIVKYTLKLKKGNRVITRPIIANLKTLRENRDFSAKLFRIISSQFNKGNSQVPRFLEYNSDFKMFVFEYSPGEKLRQKIVKGIPYHQHQFYIAECARWLHKFHQLDPNIISQYQMSPFESLVNRMIFSMNKFEKIKRNPWRNLIIQTINKWLKIKAPQLPCKLTLVHGDFHPGNVIIYSKEMKIAVIDFEKIRIFDPLFDLANFTVQYESMGFGFLSPSKIGILQDIFLKTYLSPRENFTLDELRRMEYYKSFFYIYNLLHCFIWKSFESKQPILIQSFMQKAGGLIEELKRK